MAICFSCKKKFDGRYEICPYCGTVYDPNPIEPIHLAPGTVLAQRYVLGQAVGSGGFGIIYKAIDLKLDIIVAVKEFFVSRFMMRAVSLRNVIVNQKSQQEFEYRKERFLAEARTMAQFGNHRNIPNVFEFFEENGTAYIVMELLEGQTLSELLKESGGKVDKNYAVSVTNEVGKALTSIHKAGVIHRDVAPDNIFICGQSNTNAKLLDFGAAKLANKTDKIIDIILKPGYSPPEQYDNTMNIGPWTDVYALGATLYHMLTGIKPDESTNRKIEDSVVPPHRIDSTIPLNLSNAVMKAMSIQINLRYKNVEEFLSAINGKKKAVSLKKERRRRTWRRAVSIVAALSLVAVAGYYTFSSYQEKKSAEVLEDADISIWYPVPDGSTKEAAVTSVVDDFTGKYPNITVNCRAIPEADYAAAIAEAAASASLPTLFESTDVNVDEIGGLCDLWDVLETEQANDCLFLGQYDSYYENRCKLPLAIEVPMAYVITAGPVYVDYPSDSFTSIADFNTAAACTDPASDLLLRNFDLTGLQEESTFLNNSENTCAVLLGSTMDMNTVRSALTNYQKKNVYYFSDVIRCRFTYEWSISGSEEAQLAAAKKLLSWMLGNAYQNTLMISECSDGQIPVNRDCFASKATRQNYEFLSSVYDRFSFSRTGTDTEADYAAEYEEKDEISLISVAVHDNITLILLFAFLAVLISYIVFLAVVMKKDKRYRLS